MSGDLLLQQHLRSAPWTGGAYQRTLPGRSVSQLRFAGFRTQALFGCHIIFYADRNKDDLPGAVHPTDTPLRH